MHHLELPGLSIIRVLRRIAAVTGFCLLTFNQIQSANTAPDPSRYRWPGGVIPFVIDADIPHPERIHDAMLQWTAATPIRLVRRTEETNYVRFVRENNDGLCFSSIGMIGGEQKIRTDDKCETGTLVHEIGHTVGLWHEQSRRDRDRFVRVVYQNIAQGSLRDFERHVNDEPDFSHYDFASIMQRREYRDDPAWYSYRATEIAFAGRYRCSRAHVRVQTEGDYRHHARARPENNRRRSGVHITAALRLESRHVAYAGGPCAAGTGRRRLRVRPLE